MDQEEIKIEAEKLEPTEKAIMEKGKKLPRVYTDKRGKDFVNIGFRCPLDLFGIIDDDADKYDESVSKTIVRIMKKSYNFKG